METEMSMWLETGVGMKMNVVEMGLAFPTDIPIPNTLFPIFFSFYACETNTLKKKIERLWSCDLMALYKYIYRDYYYYFLYLR